MFVIWLYPQSNSEQVFPFKNKLVYVESKSDVASHRTGVGSDVLSSGEEQTTVSTKPQGTTYRLAQEY